MEANNDFNGPRRVQNTYCHQRQLCVHRRHQEHRQPQHYTHNTKGIIASFFASLHLIKVPFISIISMHLKLVPFNFVLHWKKNLKLHRFKHSHFFRVGVRVFYASFLCFLNSMLSFFSPLFFNAWKALFTYNLYIQNKL